MKPLIIGEQPPKTGDPLTPIEGRIGRRLASYAGITMEEFLATFERRNLLDERAETNGKGSIFNYTAEVEGRAASLAMQFKQDQIVLLLGKRVARVFRLKPEYFVEHRAWSARVWVVPHPSGVNRWWNSGENARQMWQFMHTIMKLVRA